MSDEIRATSGRVVGQWDGQCANDLMDEIQKIMKRLHESGTDKLDPNGIPHRDQIPDDLRGFEPYCIWGCDKKEVCVAGAKANRLEPVTKVRAFSFVVLHEKALRG